MSELEKLSITMSLLVTRGSKIAESKFRLAACSQSKYKSKIIVVTVSFVIDVSFIVNLEAVVYTRNRYGQQLCPKAALPER